MCYLKEKVNCTELSSPSVSVPCLMKIHCEGRLQALPAKLDLV
jgi:hypothetical protein